MALTKVSTDGVKDDAITKSKIPANQIEASELADNAVDTAAIADDAVIASKIFNGAVTNTKLGTNAVTEAKIDNGAISTAKIQDQAVTLAKLPHGTSSNDGKFLRANNGADPTFETVNTDLVSDSSPQLGADLDTNSNDIKFADNDKALFGAGSDLRIYHDGSNSYITDLGTGDLNINGDDINILTNNNGEYAARFIENGTVILYNDGTEKFRTVASGVAAKGDYIGDNDWIKISKLTSYDTTKSPIQQNSKTYWYTRLDDSNSIQNSQFRNLAGSGGNSNSFQSTIIPVGNMTRQSDAGSFSAYHSSTNTQATRTDLAGADDFNIATKGLSMGCLVRLENTGGNGSGVIFYGDGNTENHFFSRYKYDGGGLKIGEDTDGSDNWTNAYPTSFFNDGDWRFIVMAVATNGTLLVSINGDRLTPVRLTGTVPTPSSAHFGIQGDLYDDNAARHRFATFWWHEGVISDALVAQEYAWMKTIWTSASGLT